MKSEFIKARIDQLAEHPAQMRTLYQIEDMATLTLQVYSNDLDSWQPITATPDGDGGYFIISGHRRRMARLFAYGLSTWVNQPDSPLGADDDVNIELVKQFIGTLVEKYEYVDAAAEMLTEHYADQEIDFVLFEGNAKSQILALQRANYGSVKPDMLGVAHSFQAALDAGATVAEVARNAGQNAHYVRNHLALNKLPQELAEKVADGDLPMSTGIAVASIKNEHKRHGLALFVLSNPPEQLAAKAVKEVAKRLANWNGLQVPLTTTHQAQRNIARSLTRLWHLVVEAYPVRSWAVISSFIYQGVNYQAPWEDQNAVDLWFKTIGGEHYYDSEGIKWESVVANLMGEVSCEACPVAKLPERALGSDLSPGRSDVLGMPCRSGGAGPCLHGLAPNDPFHVRVPWDWAQHEGIIKDATGYVALSFEALQTAWQEQAAIEDEDDSEDVLSSQAQVPQATGEVASYQTTGGEEALVMQSPTEAVSAVQSPTKAVSMIQAPTETVSVVQAPTEVVSVVQTPTEVVSAVQTPTEGTRVSKAQVTAVPVSDTQAVSSTKQPASVLTSNVGASGAEAEVVSSLEVTTPIKKMRQQIADYMQEHTSMNVDHPFATPCSNCQHKLTGSPVKDKSAPHCAWVGRWREIHFSKLNPTAGKMIPVCRQFAPKGTWAQLIPAHPQNANMPREWIKHQIETIVTREAKKTRQHQEFLTGRPMKAGENYQHWFLDQLAQCGSTLSDEQLWTLMVWVLAESARLNIWSMSKWQKPDDPSFMIPADDQNKHFIKVSEIDFHIA